MGNILTVLCALRIISFLNYSFDKIGRKGADKSPKADAGSIDGRNLARELVKQVRTVYLSMLNAVMNFANIAMMNFSLTIFPLLIFFCYGRRSGAMCSVHAMILEFFFFN